MYTDHTEYLSRFHEVLLDGVGPRASGSSGAYLTVADIYYDLVPYLTCREKLGLDSIFEYERLLLRLLAGEGGYLEIESLADRQKLQKEVDGRFPDPGLLRSYLSAGVKLLSSTREGASPEGTAQDGRGKEGRPKEETGLSDVPEEIEVTPKRAAAIETGVTHPVARKGIDVPFFEDCPTCGEPLPQRAGVSFCPFCGDDLRRNVCTSCGDLLKIHWRFCADCGADVGPAEGGYGPH